MKKILLFSLIFWGFSSYSQESEFNKIVSNYADTVLQKKYGIIALMRKNGELQEKAIGWASDSVPMTTDKIFNIGSLTKMFTAVLIMQEVENENLTLNDSIGKFFPENNHVDPNITVEQLLRHRSGLGEVAVDTIINGAATNFFDNYNSSILYHKIPEARFEKGKEYRYTNTNYILLGYLLELINDEPYSDLLKKRIFEPCDMQNSFGYYSKKFNNSAHPMYNGLDLNEFINHRFYKNFCFSAGAISSTMRDLDLFFKALYETDLLISRESFDLMTNVDSDSHYGLGIEKAIKKSDNNDDYFLIGHGGDNLSFKIRNYYSPKTKNLVIVASNHFAAPEVKKISDNLLQLLQK